MEISRVILQYVLTTVMVILTGFIIGGGLGVLVARLLQLLYKAAPGLRHPLFLLPWRTLLFGLVLFFCSPIAIFIIPSIFQKPFYPALVFILVVLSFVSSEALIHWLPTAPPVRWIGLARTFTIACGVIVAISANAAGSGILVFAYNMSSSTFKPDAYWIALGVVMGLGLVFDLLLGIVQMLLAQAADKKAAKLSAQPKIAPPIGIDGD